MTDRFTIAALTAGGHYLPAETLLLPSAAGERIQKEASCAVRVPGLLLLSIPTFTRGHCPQQEQERIHQYLWMLMMIPHRQQWLLAKFFPPMKLAERLIVFLRLLDVIFGRNLMHRTIYGDIRR